MADIFDATTGKKSKPTQRTPVAQTQQDVFGLLQAVQPVTTTAVGETVARQKLDISLFNQAIIDRRRIAAEKAASQAAFTAKSSAILDNNEAVQARLNEARANPFNDLISLFTGDPSTQDIINEQKVLQGQLNRVHRNNTNVTATFNSQLNAVTQGLQDQLGLSKLRGQQGAEIETLINRETKTSLAIKETADKTLEGFSIPMLENELIDATSKIPKGFVRKWLLVKRNEELDLLLKKRRLKLGTDKPKPADAIRTKSMQELKQSLDTMDINGTNTVIFDGFVFPRAEVQAVMDERRVDLNKSGDAFDELNNAFTIASEITNNIQSDLARVEFDSLPLKNRQELTAGITAVNEFERQKDVLKPIVKSGKQIPNNDFARLQTTRALAGNTYERALKNAATQQASRFENEAANKAAVDYYITGDIPSANSARQIASEIALNETPEAIAEASGIILGGVMRDMAKTLSDNMVSNFQDNTQADSGLTGVRPADLNLNDFLAQSKSGKLNSQVAWQRMITEKSGLSKGEEQNRWVLDISNQLIAAQVQIGMEQFLALPEVAANSALKNSLVTSGGAVKADFLNAETDTVTKIVQTISLMSAQQQSSGQMSSDLKLSAVFLSILGSSPIQNIAKQELENPAIEVQSFLRGLYKTNASSNYLGVYMQKLTSIDTVEIDARTTKVVEDRLQLEEDIAADEIDFN